MCPTVEKLEAGMRNLRSSLSSCFALILCLMAALFAIGGLAPSVHAQVGISTGTIQGTILDPNGASVPGAKVIITSKATGAKTSETVTGSGTYNSGPLAPDDYTVRV